MIFVPYGPPTCRLMGGDTDGTGMPTSKGWEVEVEPVGPKARRQRSSRFGEGEPAMAAAQFTGDLARAARRRRRPVAPRDASDAPAWEQIEAGRFMPRRIRGSCRGPGAGLNVRRPARSGRQNRPVSETTDELTVVKNATCTFCGCVCDDIELHADDERIVKTKARLRPRRVAGS